MWRSRFGLTRGRSCSVSSIHGWLRNVARLWPAIAVSAARQSRGRSGTSISAATVSPIRSSSSSRESK